MDDTRSLTFEPGNPGMFEDYAALYNTVDSQDNPYHVAFAKDVFQSIFLKSDFQLSRDMVHVLNDAGELIAIGAIFSSDSASTATLKIQVHPDYRRRGIGTKIFEYLREQGRLRGVSELACYAPSYRPSTEDFLTARGLSFSHSMVKMHIDHEKPAKPALHPWGFKVRAMNVRKELNLWASIQNKLFRGITGYESVTPEDLRLHTMQSGFDPNLVVAAEVKNIIIGLCVGWSFAPNGKESKGRILQIKGIGVHPDFQRKGFGFALVQEVMNRAYIKGHTRTELLVSEANQAAVKLFLKLGFEERYRQLWYTGPCC